MSRRDAPNLLPAIAAAALLAGGAVLLGQAHGWRLGALWLVGAALGLSLYHAGFGFAGAFRRLLAEGRGAGLRAQMLMLGVAVLLFQPALAAGEVWGSRCGASCSPRAWRSCWAPSCSASGCSSAAAARPARSTRWAGAAGACC